jgi:hypothetical protein
MFSAALAVTMTCADKRRLNLKPHSAAETTSSDFLAHNVRTLRRAVSNFLAAA